MSTFIALFRGINVGGRNKVIMKDLVSLMHEYGFEGVRTYIQSGNVVFKCNRGPKDELSSFVNKNFGFTPDVLVLTIKDLEHAIENNPFVTDEGKTCHFYFCDQTIRSVDFEKLNSLKAETETYTVKGKVLYLYAPDGVGRSKLAANIEKCIDLPVTARNLNTINKLAQMVKNT